MFSLSNDSAAYIMVHWLHMISRFHTLDKETKLDSEFVIACSTEQTQCMYVCVTPEFYLRIFFN